MEIESPAALALWGRVDAVQEPSLDLLTRHFFTFGIVKEMAGTPFSHTSNAGSVASKVHHVAVLAGKVKTVVDAARWACPYVRAGAMLARPLLGI